MSDEKKFTLDDILKEYDSTVGERSGSGGNNTEEIYETAENDEVPVLTEENAPEADNAADAAAEDNAVTEEVSDGSDREQEFPTQPDQDPLFSPAKLFDGENEREEAAAPDTSEELFADEESRDTVVPDEIIQEEQTENDADIILTENDNAWEEKVISGEIEAIHAAEGISAAENEDISEKEEISQEAGAETSDITEEKDDVNEKWIIKFLKGIFPVKGDSVGEIIRKIIFLIALIVFIGAGIMLISTLIQSRNAISIKEEAGSVIMTTVATTIDENGNVITVAPTKEEEEQHNFDVAEYYKKINKDYVGYLEVEGCDIYEPVVQGDDNDYYLKTNISGGYNKAGTVFMDYRCIVTEDYNSPNIVLYGHNQEDGTMFGNLKWYKNDPEFYSEHPVVKFSSEFETGTYLIYGYFVTNIYENQDSNGEVFHYHDYIETLNDEYNFNWYINEVMDRNQIVTPVDVRFGDQLLCLSTCSNEFSNSRFVVFARKLREGESVDDYDFTEAYLNPYAKGIDWEAIVSGEVTVPPQETEIIDETEQEDDEYEPPAVRTKSNGKKNNGSGSKSDERRLIPPAPEKTTVTEKETEETTSKKKKKTETTVTEKETEETTSKKKKKTETTVTEEETEETAAKKKKTEAEASESIAETEISGESENAVTEAPPQEEGAETEVPTAL